jgi:hypothetical protein
MERTVRRGGWGTAAAVLALALAGAPAQGAPAGGGPLDRLGRSSLWAYVQHDVTARAEPDESAPAVTQLGTLTEDGTTELVLLLDSSTDASGRLWVRARLPVRPNGTVGWLPRDALGDTHEVHTWLRVSKRRLRAQLVLRGRVVFRAPVGLGRPQWPTPSGQFYVRDRLTGFPRGSIYGALAFGTSAKSDVLTDWPNGGVVGIHGTNKPGLLPGFVSHGCVRMRNRDILRLNRLMPIGTPVTIG